MTTIPTYVLRVIGGILPMAALIVGLTSVLVSRSTTRWRSQQGCGPSIRPCSRPRPPRTLNARTQRSTWRTRISDRIKVTSAQVLAAQMQVRLAKELGRTVPPLVRRIAEAKPRPKGQGNGAVVPDTESRSEATPDAEAQPVAPG